MKIKYIILSLILNVSQVFASTNILIDSQSKKSVSLSEFVNTIQPGDIILAGESHAIKGEKNLDQINQVKLIEALISKHSNVSVGMEFISYAHQDNLNSFLIDQISQKDFLALAQWGQNPFEDYIKQVKAPLKKAGWTYGLNSPKELTNYVTKNGVSFLPKDLEKLMPPNFELGQAKYKKIFIEQMSYLAHHGMNLDLYFESQSIWDDTMAWKISEIMQKDPTQILVVIVGQFHIMYNLGLPFRLSKRWAGPVKTVLQKTSYPNLNPDELSQLIYSPEYGYIADYLW